MDDWIVLIASVIHNPVNKYKLFPLHNNATFDAILINAQQLQNTIHSKTDLYSELIIRQCGRIGETIDVFVADPIVVSQWRRSKSDAIVNPWLLEGYIVRALRYLILYKDPVVDDQQWRGSSTGIQPGHVHAFIRRRSPWIQTKTPKRSSQADTNINCGMPVMKHPVRTSLHLASCSLDTPRFNFYRSVTQSQPNARS